MEVGSQSLHKRGFTRSCHVHNYNAGSGGGAFEGTRGVSGVILSCGVITSRGGSSVIFFQPFIKICFILRISIGY